MNGRGAFFSEELLSGYLDGELSVEERQYVEQMLEQDPAIRAKYRALVVLRDRLGDLDRYRLSDEAASRLWETVKVRGDRVPGVDDPSDDEWVGAYFDGELSDAQRAVVERQIEEDHGKRRLFERLCTLHRRLTLLPTQRLDDDFAARVLRRIESLSTAESAEGEEPIGTVQPVSSAVRPANEAHPATWRAAVWPLVAIATAILLMVLAPWMGERVQTPVARPDVGTPPQPLPQDPGSSAVVTTDSPQSDGGQIVAPRPAENSPLTLVSSLRKTRLVLVYEVLITEEGVRNAAFSHLLRRHRIGFTEVSAIGVPEQKELLRQRFLENVQIANGQRGEMDRVDLYLVRTTALTADALYSDLMNRPAGVGGFALNLTTRDAESRVLNRLCEASDIEQKVGQAVPLLANFGILSSTARQLGAFGAIRWVDPAVYTVPATPRSDPKPQPSAPEDHVAPLNLAENAEVPPPAPAPADFTCELLFVVRQMGLHPDSPDGH